jgi:hypothetical protein
MKICSICIVKQQVTGDTSECDLDGPVRSYQMMSHSMWTWFVLYVHCTVINLKSGKYIIIIRCVKWG